MMLIHGNLAAKHSNSHSPKLISLVFQQADLLVGVNRLYS